MIREVSVTKVRQNLGELLNGVQYKRDSVVILKYGKPVAALVDIGLFERVRAMGARFTEITGKVQAAFSRLGERQVAAQMVGRARRTSR